MRKVEQLLSYLELGCEEGARVLQELTEGGLVLEKQVISPLQRDEAGTRDGSRHTAAGFEWHAGVFARVHHERRHVNLGQQRGQVEIGGGLADSCGHLSGGADSLQLVEPVGLLLGAVGDEMRGEELTEGRVLVAPAQTHQRYHCRVRLLLRGGTRTPVPAEGHATIEDEV